jgi:ABC-type phosphate transport system permease subunit
MNNWHTPAMKKALAKRYGAERRFKMIGLVAVVISLGFLGYLLGTILFNGVSGLNWQFLSSSDSTDAATAGIWGALKGSLLTMGVTLGLSFPIGVLAAIYLEEFAPRARWFAGSGYFYQCHASAALFCPCRWHDVGADDHAGDCYCRAQCDQIRAALYS